MINIMNVGGIYPPTTYVRFCNLNSGKEDTYANRNQKDVL